MLKLIAVLFFTVFCAVNASPSLQRPWLAPGQPIATRVESLLAAMTLEEKAMQLNYECDSNQFNWTRASWSLTSIGSIGIECSPPPPNCNMSCRIAAIRAYQQEALSTSRLGIPVSFVIETSHCGAAGGTIFPMGVTQGASWDPELVRQTAVAIAAEARAWGGDRGLSPEINVVTDPRFGRSEENFGEEPLLVSRMAVAATLGLQGVGMPLEYLASFTENIIAEAKHCCVYGYSGLDGGAADVSEKTLHDIYLKPWKAAMKVGLRGYMASHNELNGVPMHANGDIHNVLFRGKYNYTGFTHSDYGNIGALSNSRLCGNDTTCGALAIAAGIDQAFVDSAYYPGIIEPAVTAGTISIDDVNRATTNILTAKFAAGIFDGALPDPINRPIIYSQVNQALARRVAAESTVLLSNTNNNALPLVFNATGTTLKIAIIGPNSGCAPTPSYTTSSSSCTQIADTDCSGDDVDRITNVLDASTCCALCANSTACIIGVFATDQNICLLKTGCSAKSENNARILCDPGKTMPPPTPWTCKAMRGMLGGYSNLEQSTDALLDNHAHVVTILEAAQKAANVSEGAYSITWAQGVEQSGFNTSGIAAAVTVATESDVVILVLGDGGESVGYDCSVSCGEGADRPSLDLPGVQLALTAAILDTGVKTILVLVHGRPVTFGTDYGGSAISSFTSPLGALNDRAAAVIASWRPGCEGGNALWDIITGVISPSGRLSQSWPRSVGAVRMAGISPAYIKFSDQGGSGFTLNTPFTPLYSLGHGLDYLNVSYVSSQASSFDSSLNVVNISMTLLNTAPRGGKFVIEIYFTQELSRYTRYKSMLGGFSKVDMPANGTLDVSISINAADLAYYDPKMNDMILEAGHYTFSLCYSINKCSPNNVHTVNIPNSISGL